MVKRDQESNAFSAHRLEAMLRDGWTPADVRDLIASYRELMGELGYVADDAKRRLSEEDRVEVERIRVAVNNFSAWHGDGRALLRILDENFPASSEQSHEHEVPASPQSKGPAEVEGDSTPRPLGRPHAQGTVREDGRHASQEDHAEAVVTPEHSGCKVCGRVTHPMLFGTCSPECFDVLKKSSESAPAQKLSEQSSFVSERVVSEPGSGITITALRLTQSAAQRLSTDGVRLPPAKTHYFGGDCEQDCECMQPAQPTKDELSSEDRICVESCVEVLDGTVGFNWFCHLVRRHLLGDTNPAPALADLDGEGPSFGELARTALNAVKYRLAPSQSARPACEWDAEQLTNIRQLLDALDICNEALRSPSAMSETLRQYVIRQYVDTERHPATPAPPGVEVPEEDGEDSLFEVTIPSVIRARGAERGEYAGKRVDILIDHHNGEIRFDDVTKEILNLPSYDEDAEPAEPAPTVREPTEDDAYNVRCSILRRGERHVSVLTLLAALRECGASFGGVVPEQSAVGAERILRDLERTYCIEGDYCSVNHAVTEAMARLQNAAVKSATPALTGREPTIDDAEGVTLAYYKTITASAGEDAAYRRMCRNYREIMLAALKECGATFSREVEQSGQSVSESESANSAAKAAIAADRAKP